MSFMISETEGLLRSASKGFKLLTALKIEAATKAFAEGRESPFHLTGLAVCELTKTLLVNGPTAEESIAEAKQHLSAARDKAGDQINRLDMLETSGNDFPSRTLWEVLRAEIDVLSIVFAIITSLRSRSCSHPWSYKSVSSQLSHTEIREPMESLGASVGIQRMLRRAGKRFAKLFKSHYPNGLDSRPTPATPNRPTTPAGTPHTVEGPPVPPKDPGLSALLRKRCMTSVPERAFYGSVASTTKLMNSFIMSGIVLGYGSCKLLSSLSAYLPIFSTSDSATCMRDRDLGLKALAVAATYNGVHANIAGLILVMYYSFTLQCSGYRAKEERELSECKAILDKFGFARHRSPLWIYLRATVQHLSGSSKDAIATLREAMMVPQTTFMGLGHKLLQHQLAWTSLDSNQYNHGRNDFEGLEGCLGLSSTVYKFFLAGCYLYSGNTELAQDIMDQVFDTLTNQTRYSRGECLIKTMLTFYQKKQTVCSGNSRNYVLAMKINPAQELATVLFEHVHSDTKKARSRIKDLCSLTPPVNITTQHIPAKPATESSPSQQSRSDLDTDHESAVRSLLLGISHRTLKDYEGSRELLSHAQERSKCNGVEPWVAVDTCIELAVLEMKAGFSVSGGVGDAPIKALKKARAHLYHAMKSLSQLPARQCMDMDFRPRIQILLEEIHTEERRLGLDPQVCNGSVFSERQRYYRVMQSLGLPLPAFFRRPTD